jgi:DNA-directed RNA polymerase specialized sigma subunit
MQVDRAQVLLDRQAMSLTQVAKRHGISRSSVCRIVKQQAALIPESVSFGNQLSAGAD